MALRIPWALKCAGQVPGTGFLAAVATYDVVTYHFFDLELIERGTFKTEYWGFDKTTVSYAVSEDNFALMQVGERSLNITVFDFEFRLIATKTIGYDGFFRRTPDAPPKLYGVDNGYMLVCDEVDGFEVMQFDQDVDEVWRKSIYPGAYTVVNDVRVAYNHIAVLVGEGESVLYLIGGEDESRIRFRLSFPENQGGNSLDVLADGAFLVGGVSRPESSPSLGNITFARPQHLSEARGLNFTKVSPKGEILWNHQIGFQEIRNVSSDQPRLRLEASTDGRGTKPVLRAYSPKLMENYVCGSIQDAMELPELMIVYATINDTAGVTSASFFEADVNFVGRQPLCEYDSTGKALMAYHHLYQKPHLTLVHLDMEGNPTISKTSIPKRDYNATAIPIGTDKVFTAHSEFRGVLLRIITLSE